MVFSSRETGFTIIEVLIVLAVSTLLLSISLLGQGNIKQSAQFKDSIEQVHSELERVKGEAATTVNENPGISCSGGTGSSAGSNEACVVIGKVVIFSDGQSEYIVDTLVADRTDGRSYFNVRRLSAIGSGSSVLKSLDMRWGVQFEEVVGLPSNDYAITFTINPADAGFETRVMPASVVGNDSSYRNSSYRTMHELRFIMPDPYNEARIIVNGERNQLEREIL